MAEKGEQVWMDHLYTPTQTSVKTLHGVICTRRTVTHRKPCGTAMLALDIHWRSTYLQSCNNCASEAESGFTKNRLCHTWRSIRFLFPIIPVPHFPVSHFQRPRQSLTIYAINCSGRASELGGIINLVDRRRSSLSRLEQLPFSS